MLYQALQMFVIIIPHITGVLIAHEGTPVRSLPLAQHPQLETILPPREQLTMSGDIFDCQLLGGSTGT